MIVRGGQLKYDRTEREVRADFEALCALQPDDMVEPVRAWEARMGCPPMPRKLHLYRTLRTGQMLSEFFHWRDRVRTGTTHHPERSAEWLLRQWRKDPELLRPAMRRLMRTTGTANEELMRYRTVQLNSTLLTLTHFRATVSKHLCDVARAERVLDFSAGWGDRMTGFLASASVRHITLIDPRPSSIAACRRQHRFVKSDKALTTHQRGAEEVLPTLPARSVDLVVSSPPYFDLEHYGVDEADARGQIRNKASTADEYLRVFLQPVLHHSARVLRPGGVLAVNVDDNPRKGVELCRPVLDILKREASMRLVGTAGLRKGKGFGQGITHSGLPKAEPIFIFVKAA